MSAEEQLAVLRARPDIEQMARRYERLQSDLLLRLSAEVDGLHWQREGEERPRGRDPRFDAVPAARGRTLRRWTARAAVPDERWPDALAIVVGVTGRHRFGPPGMLVDRPGDHRAVFRDRYGGALVFGTAVRTVLCVHTGCHLPPRRDPSRD